MTIGRRQFVTTLPLVVAGFWSTWRQSSFRVCAEMRITSVQCDEYLTFAPTGRLFHFIDGRRVRPREFYTAVQQIDKFKGWTGQGIDDDGWNPKHRPAGWREVSAVPDQCSHQTRTSVGYGDDWHCSVCWTKLADDHEGMAA